MTMAANSDRSFLNHYSNELGTLRDNDGNTISLLAQLAEENQDKSSSIVAIIERHINRCRPDAKLWGFYLVDCIIHKK